MGREVKMSKKVSGTIKPITNIKLYGLTFYFDEETDCVGFPTFYNESNNALDYRVGHQQWIKKKQAKAIVLRILELKDEEVICHN